MKYRYLSNLIKNSIQINSIWNINNTNRSIIIAFYLVVKNCSSKGWSWEGYDP